GRIRVAAIDSGRRKEPLHTLDVTRGSTGALVHVTATNPFCARRHADLVTSAVVADHRANGVSTMSVIVAREWRVVSAWVTGAIMNRVMPVVIVIGVDSVPAAVVRLERVMRPANP